MKFRKDSRKEIHKEKKFYLHSDKSTTSTQEHDVKVTACNAVKT